MFEDALRFPWHGERNAETLVVGGILTLVGVLFLPLLFVYGYLVRVVRQTAAGDVEAPPQFSEWGDLLVDGLVAFVISTLYALVPGIVVTAGALLFVVPVTAVSSVGTDGGGGLLVVLGTLLALFAVVLSVALVVATLYFVPAAIAAYARTGRFGAAFEPQLLRPIVTDGRYATGWVVAVVVSFLAQVVASAVSATGIGVVLVPFVLFYGSVAGAYAIGVGVSEFDMGEPADEEAPASRPAV